MVLKESALVCTLMGFPQMKNNQMLQETKTQANSSRLGTTNNAHINTGKGSSTWMGQEHKLHLPDGRRAWSGERTGRTQDSSIVTKSQSKTVIKRVQAFLWETQNRMEEFEGSSPFYNPFHKEMQCPIPVSTNSSRMLKVTGKLWQLAEHWKTCCTEKGYSISICLGNVCYKGLITQIHAVRQTEV